MDIFSIFSLSNNKIVLLLSDFVSDMDSITHLNEILQTAGRTVSRITVVFFFFVCIFWIFISIIYPFLLKCLTLLNFVYACTYCTKECFPAIELQ